MFLSVLCLISHVGRMSLNAILHFHHGGSFVRLKEGNIVYAEGELFKKEIDPDLCSMYDIRDIVVNEIGYGEYRIGKFFLSRPNFKPFCGFSGCN